MAHNHQDNTHPRLFLMTHTTSIPSFQRRTADGARQLRDNFNNVIREIQPLVETMNVQNAISMSNLLNRPPEPAPSVQNSENSFVIDLELNQDPNEQNEVRNNNNVELNEWDRTPTAVEAQQIFQVILKYVPFVLILLAKAVYDYHDSIFILLILFTTFAITNSAVRKETTKRNRRSLMTLSIELLYIFACCVFVNYIFAEEFTNLNLLFNLVLIKTFKEPLTMGQLLWIVIITDFALKLVTVTVKILLTMLPDKIVPFQKRVTFQLFTNLKFNFYILGKNISFYRSNFANVQKYCDYPTLAALSS